ncbi:mRNA decay activator protein ZFP36-like [Lagopus leucura]|uniref:mRNA decay activator protein ZFP36-like n=1 Tax=Lagopus leucura TaxID=30410 RepID=UPI001C673C3A|nr:mRNA decay activator protein ZFP36-like [Lagopus leucura]
MAAATAGPAPEPLRQGPFCGQPPSEPSPEPPLPPRSPWCPPSPELGRLLRSLSAPSGRSVPPPPGFSPRLRGAPPGLTRPQPSDTALLALAALTLGTDPPGTVPVPFPSRRSAQLSSLGLALLSPTSNESSQLSPSLSPPQSPFGFSLSPPSSPPSPLYKTELCRPFTATGRCRYGARCQFAHGPEELRGLRRHPKYRTQPCSTFQRCGTCPYGSRCHFLHGPAPAEGNTGSPGSPHRLPVFDRISVSE